MSYLPVPSDAGGSLSPRKAARASRAQAKAELTVVRHALQARTQSEMDRLAEPGCCGCLAHGAGGGAGPARLRLSRAGQSAAKVELVSRHVERLSAINNRRITRRFGG